MTSELIETTQIETLVVKYLTTKQNESTNQVEDLSKVNVRDLNVTQAFKLLETIFSKTSLLDSDITAVIQKSLTDVGYTSNISHLYKQIGFVQITTFTVIEQIKSLVYQKQLPESLSVDAIDYIVENVANSISSDGINAPYYGNCSTAVDHRSLNNYLQTLILECYRLYLNEIS